MICHYSILWPVYVQSRKKNPRYFSSWPGIAKHSSVYEASIRVIIWGWKILLDYLSSINNMYWETLVPKIHLLWWIEFISRSFRWPSILLLLLLRKHRREVTCSIVTSLKRHRDLQLHPRNYPQSRKTELIFRNIVLYGIYHRRL